MRITSFVRPYAFALIALIALSCAAACGSHRDISDDDDDRDEDAGAAGRAGRGGAGAGGAAGGGPAPLVRCGSAQCPAPISVLSAIGLPAPVACCVDASKNTCGTAATATAACEPVAVPDNRCQGIDLGALAMLAGAPAPGGMAMGGCCIDNACGLDGALFGRGCVENGEAKSLLAGIPFVGSLIMVPAARACDAPNTDLDAGADDAGN